MRWALLAVKSNHVACLAARANHCDMAIETRKFVFVRYEYTEGYVASQTLDLPVDRVYHGLSDVTGGQHALYVRGEWDTTESVTIEFVHNTLLPTSAAVIIGATNSRDPGDFSGLVIEA